MARKKHALLIGIDTYRHLDGKDLEGAHNDVLEIYALLRERYAFAKSRIVGYIDDEESTREVLLGAFEDLCARVAADDVVLVYYSGHGSWRPRGGGRIESLVPADSGRPAPDGDGAPDRDILDFEVQRYLEALRQTTPWLTTIFDCCHSGSVSRDPFVRGVREIRADPRPLARPGDPAETSRRGGRHSGRHSSGRHNSGRHGVTLAACRADELAKEVGVAEGGGNYRQGAFTYRLCQALAEAPPGATWRGVFEEVAPRVSAEMPHQHPQIEGEWDVAPFDTRIVTPRPYVRVLGFEDGRVRLAGGAAHGLQVGSEWTLQPSDALHPDAAGELARLEIERVTAGSSLAGVKGDGQREESVEAGQRAFPLRLRGDRPGLRVHLDARGLSAEELRRCRRYLERSALLDIAPPDDADVLLGLEHGTETWRAIGEDGSRIVHRREREPAAIPRLVRDLESVARYRKLLEIRNPAESELRTGVRLHLLRRQHDRFVPATSEEAVSESAPGDGLPFFRWGERMEIAVENRLDRPVWASLLHFGCDFSIDLLLPHRNHRHYKPGSVRLEPNSTLQLARGYHSDSRIVDMNGGFTISRPEGFPWAAPPTDETAHDAGDVRGLVHLRLMLTEGEADFEFLKGERARDPGEQEHPLLELSRLYASGAGRRDLPEAPAGASAGWAVVAKSLSVGGG